MKEKGRGEYNSIIGRGRCERGEGAVKPQFPKI